MDREQYDKLAWLEDRSWWFRLKRAIVFDWLDREWTRSGISGDRTIVDLGCGAGGTLTRLPFAATAIGLEYDQEEVQEAKRRGVKRLVRGNAGSLPFRSSSCDAILMLDVLEHLADDRSALSEVHRALSSDGFLLATVPAHPFLWSPHDEAFHHERRYRRPELIEKLLDAGFQPTRISYAFATAFPLACLIRPVKRILARAGFSDDRADDFRLLPVQLENLAYAVTHWEAVWLREHALPFGLSLAVVARKAPLAEIERKPKAPTETGAMTAG
jgi:SAM-dependent methyltransferase